MLHFGRIEVGSTHYTKHRVLLWKRAWLRGESTRLGGAKRVMLSLAFWAPLPADSEVAGIVNLIMAGGYVRI